MTENRSHISSIKKIIEAINSRFDRDCDFEFFKISKYDGQSLRIYASRDFTFAHNFELIFEKVTFFKGDFEWSRNDELDLILIEEISENPGELRFKFVLQSDGYYYSNHNHRIEIWAESIDFDPSTVYYWNKEDLKEGERVAQWVKKERGL